MSWSLFVVFVPVFFVVSITPGMCMTLALALGMSIGLRRTLWMMAGELFGVGLIVLVTLVGVAEFMHAYPSVFTLVKYAGGLYLLYLAWQLWHARGSLAIQTETHTAPKQKRVQLALQGFVTAIANPKGWAFFIALLPPFIDQNQPLVPQITWLTLLILVLEGLCLVLYASCGSLLQAFLRKPHQVTLLHRIAASLLAGVAVWLALG